MHSNINVILNSENPCFYFKQTIEQEILKSSCHIRRSENAKGTTRLQKHFFLMLCRDKARLLRIYNAVNGSCYTNEDDLEITTLENAIYLNMKNDVSFILDFQLNLYEHQSTVNPNMPLRDLFYVSRVLQKLVKDNDLYGSALVKIPTPHFIVFYNGKKEQPERREYRLSDAFIKQADEPQLELIVTVININQGKNEQLLADCRDLREYSIYIEKVRNYAACMPIESAVERAVEECIKEGILADFLSENKAEVIAVSIFEYNEELYFAGLRQEGYERGKAEGKAESVLLLLSDLGIVSNELQDKVMGETDEQKLMKWIKLAASVDSIEQFEDRM